MYPHKNQKPGILSLSKLRFYYQQGLYHIFFFHKFASDCLTLQTCCSPGSQGQVHEVHKDSVDIRQADVHQDGRPQVPRTPAGPLGC